MNEFFETALLVIKLEANLTLIVLCIIGIIKILRIMKRDQDLNDFFST
jgi:hypothetical protein